MSRFQLIFSGLAIVSIITGCGNPQHSYRFFTENDSYHPVERPDANYTSGILFMASPAKTYLPGENKTVDNLNVFSDDLSPVTIEYGLGQTFYTPDDIKVASLNETDRNGRLLNQDRPYAGLLFLQGAIHNHFTNGFDRTGDIRRSVFAKIGLTGNGSFSEEMHTAVHKSRDLIIPKGWGMQVGQELAFSVGAEQRNRILTWRENELFGADVVTNIKGSIGNIYTGLEGGLTLRVGFNLPRQVQESTITEQVIVAEDGTEVEQADDGRKSWHFYLFMGNQTRYVLRDFAIDGRFFSDDIHTVEREPEVNEFQYGGQVRFADNWVIQALFAHRSKQFKTQRKEHSFGQYVIMYQRPFEFD